MCASWKTLNARNKGIIQSKFLFRKKFRGVVNWLAIVGKIADYLIYINRKKNVVFSSRPWNILSFWELKRIKNKFKVRFVFICCIEKTPKVFENSYINGIWSIVLNCFAMQYSMFYSFYLRIYANHKYSKWENFLWHA